MRVHKIPRSPSEVAWYHYAGWGMGLSPYKGLGRMSVKAQAELPFVKVLAYVAGEAASEIPRAVGWTLGGASRVVGGTLYLVILTVGFPLTVLGAAVLGRRSARKEIAEAESELESDISDAS